MCWLVGARETRDEMWEGRGAVGKHCNTHAEGQWAEIVARIIQTRCGLLSNCWVGACGPLGFAQTVAAVLPEGEKEGASHQIYPLLEESM